MNKVDTFLTGVSKGTVLSLLFVLLSFYGYSQCNCPPVATCGACVGGMTKITFMYDDPSLIPLPATITVSDGGGVIFSGLIGDGGTFEVTADIVGNPFIGNQITISRVLGTTININTSCGSPIFVGDTFDWYTVVSGESQGGLDICCAAEDMETEDPVIIGCPSNITTSLSSVAGSCTRVVTWTEPTANDNCGSVTLTPSIPSGSAFPRGSTIVTYTATDRYGNTSTCSFTVQVNDIHPPSISGCPSPININASSTAGVCGTNVTWTAPTASDNCSTGLTLTSNKSPGDFFPVGTTLVTYTATDAAGSTATCSFNVVVTDATNPVITNCPTTITVNANAATGTCGTSVTWTPPTVTDNCVVNMTSNKNPGDFFPVGTTSVTYTATDASGRTATCSFNVVVNDVTNPVITGCPTTITANAVATAGTCGTNVTWTAPTATDNCVVNMTSNKSPGDFFPVGTTLVTYTATDASGRQSTCTFNVVVSDVTNPVITGCPSTITANAVATAGVCGANVTWTAPTVTDNCVVNITGDKTPGQFFPVGTTLVTYTATDASGRTSTCSFNVVVNDVTNPVITGCPSNITVNAVSTAGTCGANVSWTPPTATDNCVVNLTSDKSPGQFFSVGTTPVTYTATDASGRQSTCAFNVIVVDATTPVITGCPTNITVNAPANACSRTVNWTPPTVTDNCAVTMTSNKSPGAVFSIGTTVVTYTATDASGNQAQCSFNVVVNDITKPVISGCPSNISVNTSTCSAVVSWTAPTANDICGVTLTSNYSPGATFPIGVTAITYTATDPSGNVQTCTFNVTVRDNSLPIIASCNHGAIQEVTADNECQAIATWTPPTVSDNCAVTLTSNYNPGDVFPLGKTDVVYTATDASGNVSVCSFKIFVRDRTNPVISNCVSPDLTATATTSCGAVVNWTPPTATDNCDVILTSNHEPGELFPIGTTLVTYTATDGTGNATTCEFRITVLDETTPTITNCPANISVAAATNCGATVTWTVPTATDNCQATMTSSHVPGANFSVGTTVVTYTAIDPAGNTATCSFNVTVTDQSGPVFTSCPADMKVLAGPGCSATASWSTPTFSDCSAVTLTSTHESGSVFQLGSTLVTYTASDIHGKSATCSFNVTVEDQTAPVFTSCLADITVNASPTCDAIVSWTAPVATDNCGIASVEGSRQPGSTFPVGITTVTYTATDHAGNISKCEFKVIVKNANLPVIAGCPSDQVIKVIDSGGATATWEPPTATAECGVVAITSNHQSGDVFPLGETRVEYNATDDAGNISVCSFTITVRYEDLAFTVTKLVTPDGDGINDQWVVGNIDKFKENRVTVFDRWGSVVFSATGYDNRSIVWSGNNPSGGAVPTGTYFYTITVRYREDYVEERGFIEVVR